MTREEAKEILTHNWTRVDNPNYSESELDEAFFMAIEALKADAVHNDSCDGCKYVGVIEKCEQCRRIYTEFDDLYDKGGDSE